MLIFQHKSLTLNKSEWFVHFFSFHHCCCNVLGSQNAHLSTEAYISRTLFVSRVIYNKPYCRCLSDWSWTVLARAEPCVENRMFRLFSTNLATPNIKCVTGLIVDKHNGSACTPVLTSRFNYNYFFYILINTQLIKCMYANMLIAHNAVFKLTSKL